MGETPADAGGENDVSCCEDSVVLMETSVTADEPVDDGSVTPEESVDDDSVTDEEVTDDSVTAELMDDESSVVGEELVDDSVDENSEAGAWVGKTTLGPPIVGSVTPFGPVDPQLIEISVTQGSSVVEGVADDAPPPAPAPPTPEPPPTG